MGSPGCKMEEEKEENEYEYIDFGPEDEDDSKGIRVRKGDPIVEGEGDYELVECQSQSSTWQQRVARIFRWVPQALDIPWRKQKKDIRTLVPTSRSLAESERIKCEVKTAVTDSELSNCRDNILVINSETSNKDAIDDVIDCDSDKVGKDKDPRLSCSKKPGLGGARREKDRNDSVTAEVSSDSTPPPLTTHQTRVLKSLEKVNIPSWFRPGSKPSKQRLTHRTDKPEWKRTKETPADPTLTQDEDPIGHQWLSSRETSTCPSFSSNYSRWSSTHQAYRTMRAGSTQSWQVPTTRSYKQPYMGWRSTNPQQEKVPYLLPPPQRLANSAAREGGGSRADLLTSLR